MAVDKKTDNLERINKSYFCASVYKTWISFKIQYCQTFFTIACRLLMLAHTVYVVRQTVYIFDESIIYLNLVFMPLIVIDGFIVIYARNGLEDRWCNFSLLFYVCANLVPLWTVELSFSMLWHTVFQTSYIKHIESHYKTLSQTQVLTKISIGNLTLDLDKSWLEIFKKEVFLEITGTFEASFCLVLIVSRLLIPQAGLSWSSIGHMTEYSFNTLFDVYSTLNLLRESRFTLSKWLVVINFCICNAQLLCLTLNIYINEPSSFDFTPKISKLRKLTETYYFRNLVQIFFVDVPFLSSRIVILYNWYQFIKAEIFYSIGKQSIIFICKMMVLIHYFVNVFLNRSL
jgi:hypothetical protein